MIRHKTLLLVLVSIILWLSLVSFNTPDTNVNTVENNVLLFAFGGVSIILIILFVFFAIQSTLKTKGE